MRNFLVLCLLAAFSPMFAETPRETVLNQEKAFSEAWNKRDAETISKLLTTDFFQVTRTGATFDRKGFLEGLTAGQYSTSSMVPSNTVVRLYGTTTAIVTSGHDVTIGGKPAHVLHTHVWVNISGKGWRMATFHASIAVPLEAPK